MYKTETHIFCSIILFQKSCHLYDNVEKYFRAEQATGDCGAYTLSAGHLRLHTHTQSEYAIPIAFPG